MLPWSSMTIQRKKKTYGALLITSTSDRIFLQNKFNPLVQGSDQIWVARDEMFIPIFKNNIKRSPNASTQLAIQN